MEKTCATPFWTGMMLFCIDTRHSRRVKHLMHNPLYQHEGRVAYKGQLFSAPMDWSLMIEQLKKLEASELHIALPVTGEVLAARVRIVITAGLIDLNALIKQATIRRNIVVQLIRMHRDARHPDYNVDMSAVEEESKKLAPTDEATIPNGLAEVLNYQESEDIPFLGVDKVATPAERISTQSHLAEQMDRARPLLLMAQRDSDAMKEVEASRINAFANFSDFELRVGSNLIDQFKTPYLSRVFNITLPWCVGGPDFPNKPRYRRKFLDAPGVSLHTFDAMMACRCEAQIRQDWDFSPGLRSLSFATKVNQGVSMSITRALSRDKDDSLSAQQIGKACARIYKLLWDGEYEDSSGRRKQIKGDISKISQIIGLTSEEKALLQNYHFMSSRLAGTRQVRNSIRFLVFSSRIFYGIPVFISFTPTERHSGLALHLYRGRINDPAFINVSEDWQRCLGFEYPSLCPEEDAANEHVIVDLPDYDTRRTITSRDPLCCVHAFQVMVRHDVTCYLLCPVFTCVQIAHTVQYRKHLAWTISEATRRLWVVLQGEQMP